MQGHGFSIFPELIPDFPQPQLQGAGDMHQIAWHKKQHMRDGEALPFKGFFTSLSRGEGCVFKPVYRIVSKYHQFNPKALRAIIAGIM